VKPRPLSKALTDFGEVITVVHQSRSMASCSSSMASASGSANQPMQFTFPKRSFGNKGDKRAFNSSWFQKWTWLDYNEANDSVLCFFCSRADEKNLLPSGLYGRRDLAFITKGFTNWKDACVCFK